MEAVVYHAFGHADVLEVNEVSMPVVGNDDILVRVRAAAVNPKDIFIRKGYFKQFSGTDFPKQTGFDFSGEVAGVGRDIGEFREGQAVFGMTDGWTGRTCAQYLTVKAHHLIPKPGNLTFAEAAAVPLVSLTSLQALQGEAQIHNGSRICINGASGGVGTMAIQIAKQFGASITAIGSEANHAFLKSLGADVCIDYHTHDITKSELTFDIFFDVFGNRLFDDVQSILASRGTWISTVLRPEVEAAVERTRNVSGRKARQVFVRSNADQLNRIRQWLENGSIKPVIHSVFPMARIADAHRQQETKHTRGKIVVTIP